MRTPPPRKPTCDECSKLTEIDKNRFAIWYPSTEGNVRVAVLDLTMPSLPPGCFELWIWVPGEDEPTEVHHCSASDFIHLGNQIIKLMKKAGQHRE